MARFGRIPGKPLLRWVCAVVAIIAAHGCTSRVADAAPAIESAPTNTVLLGPETVTRYRFGAKIIAGDAPVQHAKILMAVPLECPEQQVTLLSEDATAPTARIAFRQTDEGVRQMVITIRGLKAGQEALAYATYEIRTRTVLPPDETAGLTIPKRVPASLRRYLKASPMIDANSRQIRAAVDEAVAGVEANADGGGDWKRIEALYDYALEHVAYELGDDKSSVQALADGRGDCQAISATFVAMCRTLGVPARMVWVDGHQYAEFYVESAPGKGNWHSIESAGTRSFGGMPLARVILQKGDAIRVPERAGEMLRYASDFAVFPSRPAAAPAITFVRERITDAETASQSPAAGAVGADSSSAASSAPSSPGEP